MESETWLLNSLIEKTGLPKEKLNELIKKKTTEFPGLTEDAALRMIATENGVVPIRYSYKLNEINNEISHINVTATIKRKFAPRDIKIKGTPSKVMNIVLQDDSGTINAVVWDVKKVDEISRDAYEGDEISLANAYSKKNKITGGIELHIGSGSAVKIKKDPNTPETKPIDYQRIIDVKDDTKLYHLRCLLTRIFTNNIFLIKCSICNKRVVDRCEEHGEKAISKTFLISCILDDGLSSIRASFFDRTAKKLLELSSAEKLEDKLNDLSFGMYELAITAAPNNFNNTISLNVKDVKLADYKI
jgi:ssDNA-binding replication factor A large subunit